MALVALRPTFSRRARSDSRAPSALIGAEYLIRIADDSHIVVDGTDLNAKLGFNNIEGGIDRCDEGKACEGIALVARNLGTGTSSRWAP